MNLNELDVIVAMISAAVIAVFAGLMWKLSQRQMRLSFDPRLSVTPRYTWPKLNKFREGALLLDGVEWEVIISHGGQIPILIRQIGTAIQCTTVKHQKPLLLDPTVLTIEIDGIRFTGCHILKPKATANVHLMFHGAKATDLLDILDDSPSRQFRFYLTFYYKVLTGKRKEPERPHRFESDVFHVPQGHRFQDASLLT